MKLERKRLKKNKSKNIHELWYNFRQLNIQYTWNRSLERKGKKRGQQKYN